MLLKTASTFLLCTAALAGGPALPRLLSEPGLYAKGSLEPVASARPYAPQYPLWSDGAAKARWVLLPPGARIDTTNPDAWAFPVGTRFWKECSFAGKKVESGRTSHRTDPDLGSGA